MVLSSSQNILLAVSLAMCMCFLVPRMIGGRGDPPAAKDPRGMHGRPTRESSGKSHARHGGAQRSFSNMDQIKSAMEQELKSENTGSGRSMTFALMPMYAVGVALFAAYKFTKMKSKEDDKSKSQDDKKSKETEQQLMELEQHLSNTEQMLSSLLTQLDPLSTSVNTLAAEQKNEIMNQLQSIRQLMKTSGMDKSAQRNPANEACNETLDDLIHSLENQRHKNQKIEDVENENQESQSVEEMNDLVNDESLSDGSELADIDEDDNGDDEDITENLVSDGLRKRNLKD